MTDPEARAMTDIETRFADPKTHDLRPAVWRDKAGIMHQAVGAYVQRGIRLMWTACEKKDIPANSAWLQNPGDIVTCPKCVGTSKCERCDGTGAIDAPFSGSDPSCPECDGEGVVYEEPAP
jgi:hypothetical protein